MSLREVWVLIVAYLVNGLMPELASEEVRDAVAVLIHLMRQEEMQ